jgi:hypothetical protein
MSLFRLMSLEDDEIEIVTTVVRQWCAENHIAMDTARGKAATDAATNRALSGETTTEALFEAISIEMRVEQYKNPLN